MKWQLTLQIGINDCPGDKGIDGDYQSEKGREEDGEMGIKGGKSRQRNMQGLVGDDAAHRQTAPMGHCLLCLH